MTRTVSASVRALAAGDFAHVADCFAKAGFSVSQPARGILQLVLPGQALRRKLLLSVGIHGDETAPIEILADLLERLRRAPHQLAVDLMLVVGNIAAIRQGKRFIDADLNRLFRAQRAERGDLQTAAESQRADEIMRSAAVFFGTGEAEKWHFDLHTAIRPSHYPTFAVVPDTGGSKQHLLGWLGRAGIEAAILGAPSAGTFSAYTATQFGAMSATVELGRTGELGRNDLNQFATAHAALDAFLVGGTPSPGGRLPIVFRVAQELVKRSDAFRMACDSATKNFTPMAPGMLIAEDGDTVYRVGPETEYVVFPNPDVRIGLRAGLMVVRCAR
ncbi:MAG TPA: succinylglutamate desuccinylase [Noviherbaspirillum sp.]|nr:succinylglutamate desuccinylase [Noviherbaspirillum sp.]